MTKNVLSDYEQYLIETNKLRKKYLLPSSKQQQTTNNQLTNNQFKRKQLLAAKKHDDAIKTRAQGFYTYMELKDVNGKVQGKGVSNIPWWAELWECQLSFSLSLSLSSFFLSLYIFVCVYIYN